MEICTNCKFYPLCEKCEKPNGSCKDFKKKGILK